MKGFIIGLIVLLGLGAIVFFTYVSKNDHEVTLREGIVAQDRVCRNHFDNMFKVIAQTAQVPSEFMEQSKEAFKEIYQPLIEGRYQDKEGGQQSVMMKWVTESNPQFDMASAVILYSKLQVVVEAQRNEYTTQQDKTIDLLRSHKTFCSTFFNKNLFGMGSREILVCEGESKPNDPFCVRLIDSQVTANVYKTGEDNDIDLFKN
tara:strand:- start:14670 stop:15281 length:612 start_codon:yes stop_codon:yes gene_type:complete